VSSTCSFLPCVILLYRGEHLDSLAASTFQNLRKFTFHAGELCEASGLQDIRNVLDRNVSTLKRLILGATYIDEDDPWASAFESVTIENLTHLSLFTSEIPGCVLNRITHAPNLQSLTLYGSFAEPQCASELFATTGFPHLESFEFVMEDDDEELYEHVTWHFLRKREKLRRLDLGGCPWETVQDIISTLSGLRVLAVCIDDLEQIESLVGAIPRQMVAIRLSVDVSDLDKPIVRAFRYLMQLSNSCHTR